jgi:uncharacterized phage-like protein YoqJ
LLNLNQLKNCSFLKKKYMAKKTEKISAYYDKDKDGDLKGMIKKLQDNDGNYYNRSESEIIRMILAKAIPKELEKIGLKKS